MTFRKVVVFDSVRDCITCSITLDLVPYWGQQSTTQKADGGGPTASLAENLC